MIDRIVRASTLLLLFLCRGTVFSQTLASPVATIRFAPERPIIETRNGNQFVNFDMLVRNVTTVTLRISQVELGVYDSTHQLVLRRSINTDAFAASIDVIGKKTLAPDEILDVFNPFSEFESDMPLSELQYSFSLLRESNDEQREANRHRLPDDCDFREHSAVKPRTYAGRTALILTLCGKVVVWEGHDFYAHHQRVPLGDPSSPNCTGNHMRCFTLFVGRGSATNEAGASIGRGVFRSSRGIETVLPRMWDRTADGRTCP